MEQKKSYPVCCKCNKEIREACFHIDGKYYCEACISDALDAFDVRDISVDKRRICAIAMRRHGYWKKESEEKNGYALFECSECGDMKTFKKCNFPGDFYYVSKYCSRCGAKMDEDTDVMDEYYKPSWRFFEWGW